MPSRPLTILSTALVLLAAAIPSQAGLIVNLTFRGSGMDGTTPYTISGTLTGTLSAPGQLSITSGTGVFIEGLNAPEDLTIYPNPSDPNQATSPLGAFWYNDLLYLAQDPQLDVNGLLFTFTSDGAPAEMNVWGNGTPGSYTIYTYINGAYVLQDVSAQFEALPVPEPWTMAMMGAGLFTLGALLRLRKRTQ